MTLGRNAPRYNLNVVKAAHLAIPLASVGFGYVLCGANGMMLAGIVLAVAHLSSYNDRESWN